MKERVKPPLVRAWFDTVLNPLSKGLLAEAAVLVRRDLTWRAYSKSFASLIPVRSHIMAEALVNLDQFLSVYPEVVPLIDDHDKKLEFLSEKAREYHASLARNSVLRDQVQNLAKAPEMVGGGGADLAEVLAEYVVNNIAHLSNYYSTAKFWNSHYGDIVNLRDTSEIRPFWIATEAAESEFQRALEQLTKVVISVRTELSFEFGEPIVRS